jgi:thiamine-monophosphate kinase
VNRVRVAAQDGPDSMGPMSRRSGWTEEPLLRWIASRPRPALLVGSRGHDAAILRVPGTRLALCTDQTIEGVHVVPGTAARIIGRKAAARALSDLAASAAYPLALTLALAAPKATRPARLRALIEAVDQEAHEHGAALVGGDLAALAGPLTLSVTALGVVPGRRRPPGRDRARPGELVLLTGPVGGSALGRSLAIRPRFAEGRFLHAHGAGVLMDVSDGLALDLSRIARLSRVCIELLRVPVHPDARRLAGSSGRTALEHALSDGEDHELLATLAPRAWERIRGRAGRLFPDLVVIGRVRRGRGLLVPRSEGEGSGLVHWSGKGGWIHGA